VGVGPDTGPPDCARLAFLRVVTDLLERLFGKYGQVHSVTIVTHRDSRKSRGFGFVEMPEARAGDAITGLNGATVGGRELKVRAARSQI